VTSTWVPAHLAPLDGSEDALCALEEAWGSSPVSGGRCANSHRHPLPAYPRAPL